MPVRWTHLSSAAGDLPAPPGSTQQTLCLVLDVDGDGVDEFVIGCRVHGPALFWYRRVAGGWQPAVIEPEFLPLEAGGAFHDIDGDGRIDLVAGEDASGDRLFWWRNPGPPYDAGRPWTRRLIKSGGGKKHHDQLFGDFDGDGRPELIFWNQGAGLLFSAPIPPDPTVEPWPAAPIYAGSGEGLAAGDVNGDGRPELLAGGRWFEHLGGGRFAAHWIDEQQRDARVAAADLDGDGRLEVVMVPADGVGRLKWYRCDGDPREPGAWTATDLLGFDVTHGHSLAVADFNGDGHPDIFCGEMRKWTRGDDNPDAKMWLFLGDGRGGFRTTVIASGLGVHEAKVGDLDGDGRPDICAKPYNWETPRIDLWLNRGLTLEG